MIPKFKVQIRDGNKKSPIMELEDKPARQSVLSSIQKLINNGDKRVIIFKASTGIGKSTYLIHELFLNNPQRQLVCSQVTIINTLSIAQYVATLQGMELGKNIGYATSTQKVNITGPGIIYQTIKTTTSSYLQPMIQENRGFPDLILFIDEAHTNQIQMQEQLAYVRQIVLTMPDSLKPHIIVQSASIDENEFGEYFQTDFVIDVQGSRHHVQELCFDDFQEQLNRKSISQSIAECVRHILNYNQVPILQNPINEFRIDPTGSILVFVANQMQMNAVQKDLEIDNCPIPIICLSGTSIEKNPDLKNQALAREQKVIVATNVIETGFTIESLSFVIDTLKHQLVYINPNTKAQTFRPSVIDKSMMQQRRGRVGRTRAGMYIALTDSKCKDTIKQLKPISNLQMSDLKEIVLEVGYQQFASLQFMDRPTPDQLHDVLQFMAFIRYNPVSPGEYFWFLTSKTSKIPPLLKYFVIVGLELGMRIYDLAILVGIIESRQYIFTREQEEELLNGKSNQLWTAFEYVQSLKPEDIPTKLLETAQQVMQSFLDKRYDIFIGNKINNKRLTEVAVRAFIQNICIKKEDKYNSLYCSDINVHKRSAPVFVTESFKDFRTVEPGFIIDLPITPQQAVDILQKFCTQPNTKK